MDPDKAQLILKGEDALSRVTVTIERTMGPGNYKLDLSVIVQHRTQDVPEPRYFVGVDVDDAAELASDLRAHLVNDYHADDELATWVADGIRQLLPLANVLLPQRAA